MNTTAIEDQVVGPVVAHVPEVERIILFGSRARGDARPDIDWNFLIIMPSKEIPPLGIFPAVAEHYALGHWTSAATGSCYPRCCGLPWLFATVDGCAL